MDIFANFLGGLETALAPHALLFCFFGITLGTLVGALPGIGPTATMAMVLPLTFHQPPTTGLIMLAGIFYGAMYGGRITSILLKIPGDPETAVICADGYAMTKQGRGGIAMLTSGVSAFVGGTFTVILIMFLAPPLSQLALKFSSAEYFAVMVLGLVSSATIATGSPLKGIASVVLGLAIGLIGTDVNTGVVRYTFGILELRSGLDLVTVIMGVFGITEVMLAMSGNLATQERPKAISLRSMIPTRKDVKDCVLPTIRGTGVGTWFGFMPGAGPIISSYLSYALEKRIAKDPSRFGHGAIEGVSAPEAANNAAAQGSFIPLLSLGIPVTPTIAILLGSMIINGITPGPQFIMQYPAVFWGLVASFWIGNIMLLIVNIPLIGIWVRLLTLPPRILYPTVLFLSCIGVYSLNNAPSDVYVAAVIGVLGYFMLRSGYSPAPFVMGLVLGPMIEEHLKRSLLMSRGSFLIFVDRPISAVIMAITVLVLFITVRASWRGKKYFLPSEELS